MPLFCIRIELKIRCQRKRIAFPDESHFPREIGLDKKRPIRWKIKYSAFQYINEAICTRHACYNRLNMYYLRINIDLTWGYFAPEANRSPMPQKRWKTRYRYFKALDSQWESSFTSKISSLDVIGDVQRAFRHFYPYLNTRYLHFRFRRKIQGETKVLIVDLSSIFVENELSLQSLRVFSDWFQIFTVYLIVAVALLSRANIRWLRTSIMLIILIIGWMIKIGRNQQIGRIPLEALMFQWNYEVNG